ncbi:MAG: Hsp70 family protein, partial [Candidatus Nucleicultricaceae bacterium]
IPISKAQIFTTYQDGQTAMKLHIVQGERELVQDCRSLGAFQLNGIPPMKAGLAKIEVTFTLDADGLLTVTAREKSSGTSEELQVKPGYDLSTSDMKEMIYDAYEHASDDLLNRQLKQAQIRARQDLESMTIILRDETDLELVRVLQVQVDQAMQLLQTGSRDDIDAAMKSLDLVFTPLLEKRLNQLFEKTVVGRKISDLSVTKD